MEEENKKKIKLFVIIAIVLILIIIILYLISKSNNKGDKVLIASDYIIERETTYSKNKGPLPIINLKGDEINEINNEIISKYYSVVPNKYDEFKYEYYTYKNILSILITVTYFDDSEYGAIEYYSYNIKIDENKPLSDKELYSYLKLDAKEINNTINKKLNFYYNQDFLKEDISYEEYKKIINYNESNNELVIKDNTLYCYNVLQVTQSLIEYKGNINEIKIKELKK